MLVCAVQSGVQYRDGNRVVVCRCAVRRGGAAFSAVSIYDTVYCVYPRCRGMEQHVVQYVSENRVAIWGWSSMF